LPPRSKSLQGSKTQGIRGNGGEWDSGCRGNFLACRCRRDPIATRQGRSWAGGRARDFV